MSKKFSCCSSVFFFMLHILISMFLVSFFRGSPGYLMGESTPSIPGDGLIEPFKTPVKPTIDGELDDAAWQNQPLQKDFVSFDPLYGEVLPFPTLVWTAYDSKNLYFAFLCRDPEPQKIKSSLTKRDNMERDDWVGFALDGLGNKQSAYGIRVNPNGIQTDMLISGNLFDVSPDFVWESAAKITPEGYQVEICIPLANIAFTQSKDMRMGIVFWRHISRLGLSGAWPELKPADTVHNVEAPIFYQGLKKPLRLELLPSITHSVNHERTSPQEWGEISKVTELGIGLKYGITPSITFDFTLNPDFSQVESDAFQVEVNQRYPLFYSEKRPFFMEGRDIFNFFTIPFGFLPKPVHTRRMVEPGWGTKLTGTSGRASFGIIAVGDQWPGHAPDVWGTSQEGKNALFTIARGKYNIGKDNYIGVLYSGRRFDDSYNDVLGADINYRLSPRQIVSASFLHCFNDSKISTGPGNFSDRSDLNLMYSYSSRALLINGAFEHIGKDFCMETAYLKRTGINEGWVSLDYNFYPDPQKISWLKRITPEIVYQHLHDLNTGMDDGFINLCLLLSFSKQGEFLINYFDQKECWEGRQFDLNRLDIYGGVQLTKWLYLSGNYIYGDKINYEAAPAVKGKGTDFNFTMVLQPGKKFEQYIRYIHSGLTTGGQKAYNVNIFYWRTTYQFNKYFFLRAVVQYDDYSRQLLTDFLASFTLIPGTVLHVGYGGLYDRRTWPAAYQGNFQQQELLNVKRSFFFKASYLFRF